MHSPAEYATFVAHQPEDDPEVAKDIAIREIYEAVFRGYELLPEFDAHWHATKAIIDADRAARMRSRT
jgi:hypothetical protein